MIPEELKESIREMYRDSAHQHLTILLLVFTIFIISALTLLVVKTHKEREKDTEFLSAQQTIYEESSLLISELH